MSASAVNVAITTSATVATLADKADGSAGVNYAGDARGFPFSTT